MDYNDFVTTYYKKKRRSGALWTPEAVSDDLGADINSVKAYFAYCDSFGDVGDANLLANPPVVHNTPFGYVTLMRPEAAESLLDRTLDKVTLRELLAALKA